jgi:hypothetical protein
MTASIRVHGCLWDTGHGSGTVWLVLHCTERPTLDAEPTEIWAFFFGVACVPRNPRSSPESCPTHFPEPAVYKGSRQIPNNWVQFCRSWPRGVVSKTFIGSESIAETEQALSDQLDNPERIYKACADMKLFNQEVLGAILLNTRYRHISTLEITGHSARVP